MAQLFLKYRQLGVAVPGGIEIAWHTVDAALQKMEADADGDWDVPVSDEASDLAQLSSATSALGSIWNGRQA